MTNIARVILVDDHDVVREGYRVLLSRQDDFEVVADVAESEAAYRTVVQLRPDVAVIDISMPGASGLTLVQRIRQRALTVRVVICSMHSHASVIEQAFRAGADGYVSKASPAIELIRAIREVQKGARYLSADVAQALAWDRLGHEHAALASLSPREFEVLRMLVAATSVDDIAELLHLSSKTVQNIHYAIKSKLGVSTDIELMRLAIKLNVVELLDLNR